MVRTRSGVGIASISPIVVSYGNQCDVSAASFAATSEEGNVKRFRGLWMSTQQESHEAANPTASPPAAGATDDLKKPAGIAADPKKLDNGKPLVSSQRAGRGSRGKILPPAQGKNEGPTLWK